MKFIAALGVALGATAFTAYADPPPPDAHTMMMHHGMGMENIDANHDGWLSRAEASAAADQVFGHLDTNHDGRLTPDDRPARGEHMMHGGPGEAPMADESDCTRTVEPGADGHGQRVTVICNRDNDSDGERVERRIVIGPSGPSGHEAPPASGDQHGERDVTVIVRNGDDDDAPPAPGAPPLPPRPPHAPMFMMLLANSDEADRNGDGALSREEFRAQQLRFFNASDANGDGRIRFEHPPEPPAPPAAPTAPTPPPPPHH